ncbi:MAG TPA: hypothetical protein DIW47_03065 [Bacteroidetes bacterium]|nr:hypothetical protein [Bacteroidota bacterium]
MNKRMKKIIWIIGLGVVLPLSAWKSLAPNKALVDLECYEEKGKTYYRGVWMKGTGGQTLKSYANVEEFETDAASMIASGNALRDIAIKETSDGPQVVAVYDKTGESTELKRIGSWEDFEADWKEQQKAGMQIIDFDFYSYLGEDVYYGIYRKMDKKSEYFIHANWTEMAKHIAEKGAKKYELKDVDRAMINGSWHYVAFFNEGEKALEYKAFKVTSNEAVERQAAANAQKGIILMEADGFIQGNAITHLTIYVKQPQANGLFTSEDWAVFEQKFLEWN